MKKDIIKYDSDKDVSTDFITTITKPRRLETKVIKYEDSGKTLSVSSMTHISLPFFTKRRTNRAVNLEYDIGSLGITLYSILSSEEGTQQPGEFEEKIYNFLLEVLHKEYKRNKDNIPDVGVFLRDNPVIFDADMLIEKLNLKKSNSYATKISKALANLGGVTYKIKVNNKKKSQKAVVDSFEKREIKLIQSDILKTGRKSTYKVYLDNYLARRAFEKNLIMHFTDESNKRIGSKSTTTDRIYKFISLMRFKSNIGESTIDQLASIVPYELTTKNIVNGKVYTKNLRGKVIKSLTKNFKEIKDLGYILDFKLRDDSIFEYRFTTDRLGLVTDYTLGEYNKTVKLEDNKVDKKIREEKINIEEESNLSKAIEKCKRNRFASEVWNKRVDNKISKIVREDGEKYAIKILLAVYSGLKGEITKTLVQYINGVMKKVPKENMELPIFSESNEVRKEKITKESINRVDVIEGEIVREEPKDKVQEVKKIDETETPTYKALLMAVNIRLEELYTGKSLKNMQDSLKFMKTVSSLSTFLNELS